MKLEIRFYDLTGEMRWDSVTVSQGETFRIPNGAVTADIIVTDFPHNPANLTCPGPGIKCACYDLAGLS